MKEIVKKSRELAIELSTIEDTVKCFREYRSVLNDLEEANLMLEDKDLADFASEEIENLSIKKSDLEHELEKLLIPKDKNDVKLSVKVALERHSEEDFNFSRYAKRLFRK